MGLFKKKSIQDVETENTLEGMDVSKDGQVMLESGEFQALRYCKQMKREAGELEEMRREYQQTTSYLNDIQTIEEMPKKQFVKLQETAQNILSLQQANGQVEGKKKKISDLQFAQMQKLEAEMSEHIRSLKKNEEYQSMVKRDISQMEGEKSQWEYCLQSIQREQFWLKIVLSVLLGVVVVGSIIIEYIQYKSYQDMTLVLLFFLFFSALAAGICILKMQSCRIEKKQVQANQNRAIVVSNQMKAKYVNVTNAVEFACERFHVRNSMELRYMWEEYLEEAKTREAMEKNNEDLEYFSTKLIRELRKYQLYDAGIWVSQVHALADKKEMVEVKHYLLERRQKLRSKMEQQMEDLKDLKKKMLILVESEPKHQKEILEALEAIDDL